MKPIKTAKIRQMLHFPASPHAIYEMLLDPAKHAKFTGAKATMDRKAGGKFTAYDGYITGENVELVKDRKIVQRWHASDWPEGHFSTVIFELHKDQNGTELAFTQIGIPAGQSDAISKGWHEFYWDKMRQLSR